MPPVRLLLYREGDRVPVREWMDGLFEDQRARVLSRLLLLEQHGHELRRPYADLLRNGVWELRAKSFRVQLRVLYFFDGRSTVVLAHGFMKPGRKVPPLAVEIARARRSRYLASPSSHAFRWGV